MTPRGAAADPQQADALRHIAGARRATCLPSRASSQPGRRCPRLIAASARHRAASYCCLRSRRSL